MPWTPACRNSWLDVTVSASGHAPAEAGTLQVTFSVWHGPSAAFLPRSFYSSVALIYRISYLKVQYVLIQSDPYFFFN